MLTRARAHPLQAAAAVLAVVVLANFAVASYRHDHEPIDACSLVPASVVRAVLGSDARGEAFEPEGGDPNATGCTFGRAPISVTVSATPDDAGSFARAKDLGARHGARIDEVDGDGYRAYWGAGPSLQGVAASQALWVLKDGHRANVILYGMTDEAIRPTVLAAVVIAL